MVKRKLRRKLAGRIAGAACAALLAGTGVSAATAALWWGEGTQGEERALAREEAAKEHAQRTSAQVAAALDAYMRERMRDVLEWASAPTVVQSAKTGLDGEGQANRYLRPALARAGDFHWIAVSGRDAHDIATTHGGLRANHAQAGWWHQAWSDGAHVGQAEYDERTQGWGIPIAMRVDDPETGEPTGVVRAMLGLAGTHAITDGHRGTRGGWQISVAAGEGLLIAETASEHAQGRLMNPKADANPGVSAAYAAGRAGEAAETQAIRGRAVGHSTTAGAAFYAEVARGSPFAGLDWMVVAQTARRHGAAPAPPAWRRGGAKALGAGLAVGIALACALGWWMAVRTARPIEALHENSVRMSRGKATRKIMTESGDEMDEIVQAFDAMQRIVRKTVMSARGHPGP